MCNTSVRQQWVETARVTLHAVTASASGLAASGAPLLMPAPGAKQPVPPLPIPMLEPGTKPAYVVCMLQSFESELTKRWAHQLYFSQQLRWRSTPRLTTCATDGFQSSGTSGHFCDDHMLPSAALMAIGYAAVDFSSGVRTMRREPKTLPTSCART